MPVLSVPESAPAVFEVSPAGSHWRLRSSDNLFSGVFVDRRTAHRHAKAEAEAHPGHIIVIREI